MKTEQEILVKNDHWKSYWHCYFNKEIANIKKHEEIIINSKNILCCYDFAKDIPGANKQLLSEIVLQSGDLHYIGLFYDDIDFDKTKYERLMLFI
jgi:hypothetical protein